MNYVEILRVSTKNELFCQTMLCSRVSKYGSKSREEHEIISETQTYRNAMKILIYETTCYERNKETSAINLSATFSVRTVLKQSFKQLLYVDTTRRQEDSTRSNLDVSCERCTLPCVKLSSLIDNDATIASNYRATCNYSMKRIQGQGCGYICGYRVNRVNTLHRWRTVRVRATLHAYKHGSPSYLSVSVTHRTSVV